MKAVILVMLIGTGVWFLLANSRHKEEIVITPTVPSSMSPSPAPKLNGFQLPLEKADQRVTKKPFGIFITPQNSPVKPERFRGYHTGADFETFPEEANTDVPVHAICAGKLKVKEYASGYGGVVVQSCILNGSPVTVIYGHLKLSSITGSSFSTGDTIGILGRGNSVETDGERKHLHLGIHKDDAVDIRGYVSSQSDLAGWIDPITTF